MAEEYYQSAYSGAQIDESIGRIINGELDKLAAGAANAAAASQSAYSGIQAAIDSIPSGSTLIVNDLTTGGSTSALSAEQGKLLGQRPNPNLLDNWYFPDPINQRGETSYASSSKRYTIDRWSATANASVTLGTGYITATNDSTDTSNSFVQAICSELVPAAGTTVTLSCLTADGSFYSGSLEVPEYGNLYKNAFTTADGARARYYTADDSGNVDRIAFFLPVGVSIDLVAVKLELGSVQTLAHQDSDGAWVLNDPPPNKALELMKCQRYQIRIGYKSGASYANPLGVGIATSTTQIRVIVPLPVSMRATPSIIYFNSEAVSKLLLATGGGTLTPTAVSVIAYQNGVMLLFTVSGATTNEVYALQCSSVYGILLDANV